MSIATAPNPQSRSQQQAILANDKQCAEIEELDAAIGRLSRQINASSYQLMTLIREFDERGGWLKWGFTDALAWLRWRCDLSSNAARDKLRVAHALKKLPAMSTAFKTGSISYSKVRALTRIANKENEQELVDIAATLTAANVEIFCRQRVNATKNSTANANRTHDNRSLRIWCNEKTGLMNFSIELTIEEGALFEKAIEKAAVGISSDVAKEPDKLRKKNDSWHALQADAAVLIVKEYLSGKPTVNEVSSNSKSKHCSKSAQLSTPTADLYQVVVHVDETALVKGNNESTTDSTSESELPIDTVRRLCCDGSIIPIIENAKGEPLNVGRKVRTITTAIRRALWSRDKGCAFPGCQHTRYVDAHHIKHWVDDGETSVNNLILLCTKHHRLVHEGGYTIETDSTDNTFTRFFRRPDGRVVPDCGYRLDDYQDDYQDDYPDNWQDNFIAHSGAEVASECREDSGFYLCKSGRGQSCKNSREFLLIGKGRSSVSADTQHHMIH